MWRKKDFSLYSVSFGLLRVLAFFVLIIICLGGELSETESFFNFINVIDPNKAVSISWNASAREFCSYNQRFLDCNLEDGSIVGIRLESSCLAGVIDGASLCSLLNLEYVNLANNLIHGSIPESIANCRSLTSLNLSNNQLSGKIPVALQRLKSLKSLDISKNHFRQNSQLLIAGRELYEDFLKSRKLSSAESPVTSKSASPWYKWLGWIPVILGIGFFLWFTCFASRNAAKLAREKEILKALRDSPVEVLPTKPPIQETKPEEERRAELVFFVEEQAAFKMNDLLEAGADLQNQNLCSSLYKVVLKNNAAYAVKRLKKLQVSFDEFGRTMRKIGYMKHPNILPLVGYNSTNEEKLLMYNYQDNGSLLHLLDNYVEGRRDFPWRLRLLIALGIVRGLEFIHQKPDPIPHGNLKLSNILLDDDMEPLISEYGFSRFTDPNKASLYSSNGYMAPERSLSEAADVYSFGVILLELLTGKTVEKTGIDLPKWVKSMVREEWTGEVFDKEVSRSAKQWAFPLLNVALKCVSVDPDSRPSTLEVLEKIEEVAGIPGEVPASPSCSIESSHQDCCLLHSVIPETWDTPGSNS
ncbi:hypothetical protein CDL15_Pgr012082 [Punica granatum]|uniref:Protein kinase domain-containing protein n=1 Tax=Punica granatum TaxID=22663 RepID=A0A218XNF3_PUNGR|nr:hypothetical protein CDL15_Pgr012082 [Punica granatum]